MELLDKHIDFIDRSLTFYGIKNEALRADLVDHICTYIENAPSNDFDMLYQKALNKFGGYTSFQNIQLETNYQKLSKQIRRIKRLKFFLGLLIIMLLVLSLVFKIMHWPYANVLFLAAVAFTVFGILPIHFYASHKITIHKFS